MTTREENPTTDDWDLLEDDPVSPDWELLAEDSQRAIELAVRLVKRAMAAQIKAQDAQCGGQKGDQVVPDRRAGAKGMDEDEGGTVGGARHVGVQAKVGEEDGGHVRKGNLFGGF